MANWYLNSYRPLVASAYGRRASELYNIPPFVDGSIRREPDLEHAFPSISCICRAGKFAPHLRIGDVVGYLTVKGLYGQVDHRHWRLTAILRVLMVFDSHAKAQTWYSEHDLPLPNNCLVSGNAHKPIKHSHRIHRRDKNSDGCARSRSWDCGYRQRVRKFGTFVVCERKFIDLSWNAPKVSDECLLEAFERIPGTRNPGKLSAEAFCRMVKKIGISANLSV